MVGRVGCWAMQKTESLCASKCAIESFWSWISSSSWSRGFAPSVSEASSESIGWSWSGMTSSAASAASRRASSSSGGWSEDKGGLEDAIFFNGFGKDGTFVELPFGDAVVASQLIAQGARCENM